MPGSYARASVSVTYVWEEKREDREGSGLKSGETFQRRGNSAFAKVLRKSYIREMIPRPLLLQQRNNGVPLRLRALRYMVDHRESRE